MLSVLFRLTFRRLSGLRLEISSVPCRSPGLQSQSIVWLASQPRKIILGPTIQHWTPISYTRETRPFDGLDSIDPNLTKHPVIESVLPRSCFESLGGIASRTSFRNSLLRSSPKRIPGPILQTGIKFAR